ncbi:hypothetical protein JXI42_13970 [bacterium]|nr:hypothetical protein [bacterium]
MHGSPCIQIDRLFGEIFIDPEDSNILYVKGVYREEEGIFKSSDNALTWNPIRDNDNGGFLINHIYPNIIYHFSGEMYARSIDRGTTWEESIFPFRISEFFVDPFDGDILYIKAYATQLYKSTDAGRLWIHFPEVPATSLNSIIGDSSGNRWFIKPNEIIKWDGAEFDTFNRGEELYDEEIEDFACAPDGNLWIMTANSYQVYDGENWNLFTLPKLTVPDTFLVAQHGDTVCLNTIISDDDGDIPRCRWVQRSGPTVNTSNFSSFSDQSPELICHNAGLYKFNIYIKYPHLSFENDTGVVRIFVYPDPEDVVFFEDFEHGDTNWTILSDDPRLPSSFINRYEYFSYCHCMDISCGHDTFALTLVSPDIYLPPDGGYYLYLFQKHKAGCVIDPWDGYWNCVRTVSILANSDTLISWTGHLSYGSHVHDEWTPLVFYITST